MRKCFLFTILISTMLVSNYSKCFNFTNVTIISHISLFYLKTYFQLKADHNIDDSYILLLNDYQNNFDKIKKICFNHKKETINGSSVYEEFHKGFNNKEKLKEITNYLGNKLKTDGKLFKRASECCEHLISIILLINVSFLLKQSDYQWIINKSNLDLLEHSLKKNY